ncbi:GntR family transcriptional regulator [Cellulomonas fimi]|uniref:GntR family transcriptional regulator n=1 Tax=Cellulomonas fimi TaxID=1708 RepID=A0A7Y0QHK0_CELFI|nr:GntR family transcriptional regulator [Cellulomonas fimi]NMR19247.1 GntR family transcriptional regulator [Cellulomonas fimi]
MKDDRSTSPLGTRVQLRVQLADDLRARLQEGEWPVGAQLPTEGELASRYGVSRSTVRGALQQLEIHGLTVTRHGVGTFVTPFGRGIKAGLQELQSITDTVAAHGMEPGMQYRSVEFREASQDELDAFAVEGPSRVLAVERAVLADGVVVAFSYDTIPAWRLPTGLDPAAVKGSLFHLLESAGIVSKTAVADIHAARGAHIGWGERPPDQVYLLLEQTHYDASAQPVLRSRTYFIEGRFQFSILRTR